ncbi:subtilisin family serine protease [Lysobacter enzymogenes]|uniref:S8 family peptidase n=1 Tax=Lysobacter enzymogenes TaxID=69 RepID=UPI0033976E4C
MKRSTHRARNALPAFVLDTCLALAACLALTGCAQSLRRDPAPMPDAPAAAMATQMDPQRDVLVVVDNPVAAPPARAGSNLLGYAPARHYGLGQQAAAALQAIGREHRLREVAGWPIKSLGWYCAVLRPAPGESAEQALARLGADARVKLAQPLQDFSVQSARTPQSSVRAAPRAPAPRYNDPYLELQRGFIALNAGAAHARSRGRGVGVAIVDTGADAAHPDLHGRIRTALDLVEADPAAFRRDAHGTEVAGIVAANSNNRLGIAGIAPLAVLDLYKACWYPAAPGDGARCNSFTLAKALAAVADSRARVVNLSLGGPADPLLRRLLQQLLEQGRIVVASLPADGRMSGFPADTPGVIVVGDNARALAPGSLGAPGSDILTTRPGGGYDFASGSSMAAAHVSGVAALLLSAAPSLDAARVRALLFGAAGAAREVDAAAAVEAAIAGPAAPAQP